MRVLLTTDTIGGVWTFTQELTEELLKRGHSVALLSFGREPSMWQREACERLRMRHGDCFHYEASTAPLEWMPENQRVYIEGLSALLNLVDTFQAELVHSSQFCFGDLPLAVPVVVTAHSDVLSWAEACRPQGLAPSAWLDRYRAMVERGLEHASAVVAPTLWMSDTLRRTYGLRFTPRTILNGRDVGLLSECSKRLQAVSVGRLWDEGKNLALLTDVDSRIPILVAGEQGFREAAAVSGQGNLTLLGALSQQDVLDLFAESSFYLAPSRYEPFGLAPLEAAQCGCALLLMDLPSLREIWGEAALYFSDAASLSELLSTLSPESISQMQRRSQQRASQLTAAWMAEQYENLYRELLAGSANRSQELATHAC